jgi:hypothetical protein
LRKASGKVGTAALLAIFLSDKSRIFPLLVNTGVLAKLLAKLPIKTSEFAALTVNVGVPATFSKPD